MSVNSHKHLGITLSNDLQWEKHIDNIIKATGEKVDVLSRLMYRLDRRSLEVLYTTYVRPSLEYGDVLLSNISISQKESIELAQKRAGKIISGAIRGVSINIIYHELGWESLEKRRGKYIICLFHKIVNGHTPAYLCMTYFQIKFINNHPTSYVIKTTILHLMPGQTYFKILFFCMLYIHGTYFVLPLET